VSNNRHEWISISVNVKPLPGGQSRRPLVFAVFSFRDDAHLVPNLIENIEPFVDGWIAGEEMAGSGRLASPHRVRKALLESAAEAGAQWILAVDPAERFESALADRIRDLTAVEGPVAYAFHLRSMYSSHTHRVDGRWGTQEGRRLFSISPGFLYEREMPWDHWYPSHVPYRYVHSGLNLYDFRTATAQRRRLKRDTYIYFDPLIAQRPFIHDYLISETGSRLEQNSPDCPYNPEFVEDHGLWSPSPPTVRSPGEDAKTKFKESIRKLTSDPRSPVFGKSHPGFRRGIEVVDENMFNRLTSENIDRFASIHGYLPDLFEPKRFLEKILWRKLFGSLPVPQSGNKLLTGNFIPARLANRLRVPRIVWRSRGAALPENDSVPEGWYYLKSNHGSGNVIRLRYPHDDAERQRLQKLTAQWLQQAFYPQNFEWWYNVFPREIFLEESIEDPAATCTWSYPAFSDDVPYVNVSRKTATGVQAIRLSLDLDPLPEKYQPQYYERLATWHGSFDTPGVAEMAREIAGPLGFARVDFLFKSDGTCYLNEVTLTPNNGMAYMHPDLDVRLGAMWKSLSPSGTRPEAQKSSTP